MSEEKSIFPATSMAHENPKFPSLTTESSSAGASVSSSTQGSFFPSMSMATDTQVTLAAGKEESTVQASSTDKSEPVEESSTEELSSEQEAEEQLDKVFCKSCRAPKGSTEAGTEDEPLRNFGDLAILQSPPEDSDPSSPLHAMAASGALALKGATDFAELKLPKLGAIRVSAGGVITRIPWLALFFPSKLGDGTLASMDEINQAGAIESRVKFNFYVDNDGKEFVSGYHDGSGTSGYGQPIQSVEAKEDKNSTSKSYIADLGGGIKITWFPEESDKTPLSTPLPRPQRIDPSTILVRPIDSEAITTTIYPEEEIIELIVTFPADSGIEPLYLVFKKTPRDEPGVVTGKGEDITGVWLARSGKDLGSPIPTKIADNLRGQTFKNFNEFRKAFWQEVAADATLLSQFGKKNQKLIKKGKSPFSPSAEHYMKLGRFEIHHIEEIQHGGDVYGIDNLRVVTPKNHKRIHYGDGQ